MRIFIDTSFVDFGRQPTGIPRVVLKYIEAGYEWGRAHGVDVVPVITTENGLIPVRPIPGKDPPPTTTRYAKGFFEINGQSAAAHLRQAETSLRAALVDAGVGDAMDGLEAGVSSLVAELVRGGKEPSLRIDPGPGDAIFFPAYWHDLDPVAIEDLRSTGAQTFILVHDILPISFSKFYQAPWRYQFADNLLAAIQNADGLLAVSNYSAAGVLEFARQNGVELDHVRVQHNGFDYLIDDEKIRQSIDRGTYRLTSQRKKRFEFFRDNCPYLMVGTIEPKKGHIPIIESMESLWNAGLDRKLALVGRRGWMEEQVVNRIVDSPYFEDKLFWFDDLDDIDLYLAYKESRALIFSSYAEGFGIPMVEAAMSGLPMICYDTPVAREVSGDFGLYYSNFSEFQEMIGVMESQELYAERRAKLDEFNWPSWQETGFSLFNYLKTEVSE